MKFGSRETGNLVRVSGEFELSEFAYPSFTVIIDVFFVAAMTAGKGGKLPLPEFGSKQANGVHSDSAKFNNLKIVF